MIHILLPANFTGPKTHMLFSQNNIITNDRIFFDISEVEFCDETGTNILLLFPFFLSANGSEIIIIINSNNKSYYYLKMIQIISKFEKSFYVFDTRGFNNSHNIIDSFQNNTHNSIEYLSRQLLKTKQENNNETAENSLEYQKHMQYQKLKDSINRQNNFFKTYLFQDKLDMDLLFEMYESTKFIPSLSLSENTKKKISTCFTELIKNVFDHSEQNVGALSIRIIGHSYKDSSVFISVSDLGIGVKNSFMKSDKYKMFAEEDDAFFLKEAIKFNTSSTDEQLRGMGLYYVSKYSNKIFLTSGSGLLAIDNDNKTEKNREPKSKILKNHFKGFTINSIIKITDE